MGRAAQTLFALGVACNADVPPPMISSVFPDHSRPGTQVTIEGSSFCQQAEEDEDPLACENVGGVVFDQSPAEVLQYLDTSISVTVPEAPPGSVRIVIQVAGRTSDGVGFVVTP
jgi:hypothetical protein